MMDRIWTRAAVLIAAGLVTVTMSWAVAGNETTGGDGIGKQTAELIGTVEQALAWLVRPHRWHPLSKSNQYRYDWANAIAIASTEHDVPPLLLTAMGWFEGSYQKRVLSGEKRGKARGEYGMWQQHGAAMISAKKKGFDLTTKIGQARAGASWLKRGIDQCGTVKAGLTIYACGRCKAKAGTRPARQVELRLGLWKRLQDIIQGRDEDDGTKRIAGKLKSIDRS